MMPYGLPDPSQATRRLLSRAEQAVLDEALALAARVPGAAARMLAGNLERKALDTLSMLSKVPQRTAEALLHLYKGIYGRPLAVNEHDAIAEAFPGKPIALLTHLVRVIDGPGLSVVARIAFNNTNPAITLGTAIYVKQGLNQVNYSDLTRTAFGRAMIVHEFTHVLQWVLLGPIQFGVHYAADMVRVKGDADKLYQFWNRKSPFALETLEGQAEMVGDYKEKSSSGSSKDQKLAAQIRQKLKGMGIYGY